MMDIIKGRENEMQSSNSEGGGKQEDASVSIIKVLFFARARELTGLTEIKMEVSKGSTAHDCLGKIIKTFPGLEEIEKCMVLALNEEYIQEEDSIVVKDKDELAIIPPISGG